MSGGSEFAAASVDEVAAAGEVPERFCGHCGKPADDETAHRGCAARLELEPPRYCVRCARRMVVQVVPTGWTARCSAHGLTSA